MARKLMGPTESRRRHWLLLVCLVFAAGAAVVLIPGASADSVKAQTFELDGNVVQDHPGAPTTYDWANFFGSSGNQLALPTDYTGSVFVKDFNTKANGSFDTSDSSTYTNGSKDTLNISTGWSCTPSNNVTDKGDIMNAYAALYTNPSDGHKILYFSLERNANTGDANVAFWFLQGKAGCTGTNSFTGDHHDGDLLIVSAFTNGGVVSTIDAYKWVGGANGSLNTTPVAHGVDCKNAQASADPTCATSNTAAITTPWLTDNKTDGVGHTLETSEFFEGGLDLSAPGINLGNDCFNTFLADTRSSQSLTATLYDFALGNLGGCTATVTTAPVDTTANHNPVSTAAIPLAPADAKVAVQDQTVIATTGAPATYNASVDWHICGPTDPSSTQLCDGTTGNVGVDLGSMAITADGTYYSPTATVTAAGRYCFRADFSGDSSIGLDGTSDSGANECFVVTPRTPTLTTTATQAVEVGHAIDDVAHLGGTANEQGTGPNGSINPTTLGGPAQGMITFNLYSTANCSGAIATRTVNVNGNGDYTASTGTGSGSLTPSSPGTYYWTATYSGDPPNTLGQTDGCGGANESSNVVDANITITPLNPVNEVGTAEVFTVTFTAIPAGTTPAFSGGTNGISINVSPAPASQSTTCGAPTISGNVATCTVTINSPTAGTFNVGATGKVTMGGLQLTRATGDGAHGDSASAVKNYVDATIAITPLTPVNEVGNAEVFTVTFTAYPAGTGTPAFSGGSNGITISVSPAPGSQSTTCGSPTISGNVATCTVTINSNSSGTFTVHAVGKVTMGGLQLTRATGDGAHGDSADAVKNYVDANITISPLTPVNEVGTAETFTVTFTASPAGTGAPAFSGGTNGIGITVSPTPDLQNTNTCANPVIDITGLIATCTVTINNSTPGVFTVHAVGKVTMGGLQLTRATGDGAHGDSADAVKTYGDANIKITPLNPVNEVGTPETFTVTFTVPAGSGSTPDFTTGTNGITISVTPAPGSESDTCATPTIDASGNVATCTVTINNAAPGTFTVNATGKVTIDGLQLTRATGDGAHGDSANAVKNYVDAKIAITPLNPVNEVGTPETFTVTFTAYPAGTGTPAFSGGTNGITIGVSPSPGSESDTCGSPTINGNVATCTVTINSPTAGTFTVSATGNVTMGGLQLTRATGDGAHGDSPSAVKNYVDANIAITPLNPVNEVGNAETFTVTFSAYAAGTGTPAFSGGTNGITIGVSPSPDSESDTCATPTINGNVATCTVTINNNSTGQFTVTATGKVTMGGLQVTRQTGDGAHGDSPSAVKTYVDALITITPSATNGITENHTFTVNVQADNGDGTGFQPVAGVNPTVTLTSAGGAAVTGLTDYCAGTGTDASGNCTVTFTSNSAGTVTGHASITLTVAGLPVTRATGDSHANDGTDAVKTFVQGSLSWLKQDGSGAPLGGATFQVCATAGTAFGLTPQCVSVLDNGPYDANPADGQFTLNAYQMNGGSPLGGLALGTYTIQETQAPAGYTLDGFVETVQITQANLNPAAVHIWVDTSGFEGCTPGFWKNHLSAWSSGTGTLWQKIISHLTSPFGYNAGLTNYNNQPFFGYGSQNPPFPSPGIFGLPSGPFQGLSSTLTLKGALNLGGGGFAALARHGTAALLSAGSVKYEYGIDDVLNGVRNAFLSGNPNLITGPFSDGVLTDLSNANNQPEQACPTS
jgi:Prealbumin-like fold domain